MRKVEPLSGRTLTGRFVALEPLENRHHAALIAAAQAPCIFDHMPVESADKYAAALERIAQGNARGEIFTYAVRRLRDDAIVGSTSYLTISPENARVEIGWTWYVPGAQGGAVNPEAKYLLLANAFAKAWNRVEFKTDARNLRSRAALKKLGARQDGIMRAHMWMPQGYYRDSVYFSILASDWPEVKAGLEKRLAAFG
jgi:RimJ/RimL family protein N-acetyltransferase